MSPRKKLRLALTDGEQSLCLAYFSVGIFSAGLAFIVVNQLSGGAAVFRPLSAYDLWVIFAGAVGGCAGLFLGRRWMGHNGVLGFIRALVGMFIVSFLGALIGGTLALPLYGTMFGPFSLIVALIGAPQLAMFWGVILLSAHFLICVWRRERDTVFGAPQNTGMPA